MIAYDRMFQCPYLAHNYGYFTAMSPTLGMNPFCTHFTNFYLSVINSNLSSLIAALTPLRIPHSALTPRIHILTISITDVFLQSSTEHFTFSVPGMYE